MATARVVVLAGPSGSGKSRLARASGLPVVALDDFYRPATDPTLPHDHDGQVDWERPEAWDRAAALAAVVGLCQTGAADVPTYSYLESRPVGTHRLDRHGAPVVLAEGLFAAELIEPLRAEGLLADALALRTGRWLTFARRLRRDRREHRKPLGTLLRMGWHKLRLEPRVLAHQVARGARPVTQAEARAVLARAASAGPVSVGRVGIEPTTKGL